MSKMMGWLVAAAVLTVSATLYAADPSCPACQGPACQAPGAAKADCADMFKQLNLTEEQQTKVKALREECAKVQCKDEAREKMMKGMESILTADQMKQLKEACEKAAKAGGCPFAKAPAKADDAKK